uniref:4-hydroxythreonine-4-phosphate dehydrogenase PdxA n=1 Tax=Marinobacterium profundum TaxID=1714300 RepID=UPI00082F1266|nr:4-hydroxythreonine-4-phosphate dehydrogenase PdxA [Marinobacterium profundum]
MHKPTVALTLGDPAGIGAELIAKLLSIPNLTDHANIVLIGDQWLWQQGQQIVGVQIKTRQIGSLADARQYQDCQQVLLVTVDTISPAQVQLGVASPAGGASVLQVLDLCLKAVTNRDIDAICFAPLNKQAMKLSGMKFEDELHYFAHALGVTGFFCEFNTLGDLWTSRISSHVPFKDIARYVEKDRIKDSTRLIYQSLQSAGYAQPRVAVAAFNPHGGDGGSCGREEIDIITPAISELNVEGVPVSGPFPADTIFLKARDGEYDAIVTMYHDQGQIAIKLLGFEKGVTVQGGLPVPITTPAHGTAYDIAGLNKANVTATEQAFFIACRMGENYRGQAAK